MLTHEASINLPRLIGDSVCQARPKRSVGTAAGSGTKYRNGASIRGLVYEKENPGEGGVKAGAGMFVQLKAWQTMALGKT
ncbi:hypothetical protein BaRGS_00034067, partial [Batillaria attramentaria]